MERLYTLEEVAQQTGLPLRALADGARAKPPKFAHLRIAGRRWMTEEQVQQLINQHVVSTADPQPVVDPVDFEEMHRKLLRRAARG